MKQAQQDKAAASSNGAGSRRNGRSSAASGKPAGANRKKVRDALGAPFRWARRMFAKASRWLRRRLKFAPSALLDMFKRLTRGRALDMLKRLSRERGFGFWWLVVTLALAAIVGLLVAALLTPVTGILACLGVGVWFLFRKVGDKSRNETGSAATA